MLVLNQAAVRASRLHVRRVTPCCLQGILPWLLQAIIIPLVLPLESTGQTDRLSESRELLSSSGYLRSQLLRCGHLKGLTTMPSIRLVMYVYVVTDGCPGPWQPSVCSRQARSTVLNMCTRKRLLPILSASTLSAAYVPGL